MKMAKTPPPTKEEVKDVASPQETQTEDLESQLDEFFEKGTLEEKEDKVENKDKTEEEKVELEGGNEEGEEKADESKSETEKTEETKAVEEKPQKEEKEATESKEKPKDEEQGTPNQDETKLLEELGLGKFKSVKSALEAYKNLESAYGRAQSIISSYQKGVIPQEMKDGVEGALNLASKPRVRFEVPDPNNYTDEEGNFDIASYFRDALTDYTLNLQKSLILGELGSALYTLQKTAILEKQSELEEKLRTDEEATDIARKLTDMFPVLERDEKVFQKVSRAWAGEAQLLGRKLTLDDFVRVTKEVLGDTVSVPPKEEEKVESVGGVGNISDSEIKPQNKEEEIAKEILEASLARSSSFF